MFRKASVLISIALAATDLVSQPPHKSESLEPKPGGDAAHGGGTQGRESSGRQPQAGVKRERIASLGLRLFQNLKYIKISGRLLGFVIVAGTGQVEGRSLIFTMDAHAKSSVRWPEGQTGSWWATVAQYCLNQEDSFKHSDYPNL